MVARGARGGKGGDSHRAWVDPSLEAKPVVEGDPSRPQVGSEDHVFRQGPVDA